MEIFELTLSRPCRVDQLLLQSNNNSIFFSRKAAVYKVIQPRLNVKTQGLRVASAHEQQTDCCQYSLQGATRHTDDNVSAFDDTGFIT